MPIYTEIVTTFKGEGSRKIHEWAQGGDEGVFFARVFGYDYENATEEDWDEWEYDFDSYRTGNMSCGATMNKDKSVVLSMNVCGSVPYGVFEKIAETFPKIHADGRFIQQTEEYFGNIVIENGGFLWTKFDNPGRRSGKDDFFFDSFFRNPEEEPGMDQMQREVLELLKFDRDNMRDILAKGEQLPKKLDYNSRFYFSELELNAITGNAECQYQIAEELLENEFYDNNPRIYNKKDKIERECCEQYFNDMGRSWLKRAALNGHWYAQRLLVLACIDGEDFNGAKKLLMKFHDCDYFVRELDSYSEDDATSLLRLICLTDISYLMEFYLDRCEELVDEIRLADRNYGQMTLLEYAALHGAVDVVKLLIGEYDATFSMDAEGRSLWILAIKSGNPELVEYLAEDCSFDINCKDEFGDTPLHHAVTCYCETPFDGAFELIKWLVENGAYMNCTDINGDTPVRIALEKGNECLVRYFIKDCHTDSSIDDGHN